MFNQKGAVGAVYRQIPEKIRGLDELGLPTVLAKMADRPRGLVLVTGPTGSGKSTTLAAMIDKINTERTATSSPSKTRSSTCTSTRAAWSTSARCTATPTASPTRCARRFVKTPTWC